MVEAWVVKRLKNYIWMNKYDTSVLEEYFFVTKRCNIIHLDMCMVISEVRKRKVRNFLFVSPCVHIFILNMENIILCWYIIYVILRVFKLLLQRAF